MKRYRRYGALNEINITNLVDVTLVLLIIFMITAPLLRQGIDVKLPKSLANPLPASNNLKVSVTREGHLYLDNRRVDQEQFPQLLLQKYSASGNPLVTLEADQQVPYGKVIEVMDKIKSVGIDNIGLVVEPPEKK